MWRRVKWVVEIWNLERKKQGLCVFIIITLISSRIGWRPKLREFNHYNNGYDTEYSALLLCFQG